MDFVWIYIKSPSYFYKSGGVFNELEWSIKSVQKFYKGARCIVVGDDPELDVIHLPCERIETCSRGYFRHFDMIKKVQTYLNWTKKSEFVLMYDDIYFLKPVIKLELKKAYAKERILSLNDYFGKRNGDASYVRCWESTYKRILEFREDLWDWETHLPRYYNIKRLKSIISDFSLHRIAYLAFSLYAARYYGEPDLVTEEIQSDMAVYKPLHTDYDKDFKARFMNVSDNGITGEFIRRLQEWLQ
jgi:hypothetical protein